MKNSDKLELKSTDEPSENSLIPFVRKGNLGAVQHLIKSGIDINAKNERGYDPLMIAIYYQHSEIAKLLYKSGGKLPIFYQDNTDNLIKPAFVEYLKILDKTIDRDSDFEANLLVNIPSMSYCSANGYLEIMQFCLRHGDSRDVRDLTNRNVYSKIYKGNLELAAENGHEDIVKFLLKSGFPIGLDIENPEIGLKFTSNISYLILTAQKADKLYKGEAFEYEDIDIKYNQIFIDRFKVNCINLGYNESILNNVQNTNNISFDVQNTLLKMFNNYDMEFDFLFSSMMNIIDDGISAMPLYKVIKNVGPDNLLCKEIQPFLNFYSRYNIEFSFTDNNTNKSFAEICEDLRNEVHLANIKILEENFNYFLAQDNHSKIETLFRQFIEFNICPRPLKNLLEEGLHILEDDKSNIISYYSKEIFKSKIKSLEKHIEEQSKIFKNQEKLIKILWQEIFPGSCSNENFEESNTYLEAALRFEDSIEQ